MLHKNNKTIFYIFLLTLCLNLFANEKVTLQLQWKHQFEFAGFYAAKEKGFYSDAGLDVEFLEHNHNDNIIENVLNKKAEYGLVYSSLISEYYAGKPLVFVANFFKQSPLVLIVQKDIKTPADLYGKRIMGNDDSVDNITIFSMLNKFNIHKNDYKKVATTYSMDAFIQKRVDAVIAFTTNETYVLDQLGVAYNVFDPTVYGVKYYDVNLFTSKEELKNHPKRVQKFREASIKGWEYALSHKSELVEIIKKKYNTQNKTADALMFEANQIESIMLPNIHPMGSIDKERVNFIVDEFKQAGFIEKDIYKNLDNFIYDSGENRLVLNAQEKQYLQDKKNINVCADPHWMPIEGFVDGVYSGLNSEFIAIFKDKFKIPFHIIETKSWDESLKFIKEKKCDILSLAHTTSEREKFLNFTKTYLTLPISVVTKKESRSIVDIGTLENTKFAVIKGYSYADIIKKEYPNIELIQVSSIEEGIGKVLEDEVLGFVELSSVVEFFLANKNIDNLKFNVQLDDKLSIGMAVAKDDATLYSIMQKLSESLSQKEKTDILKRWMNVQYQKVFDYSLFYKFLLFAIVIALFFLYRHWSLNRLNRELHNKMEISLLEADEKNRMIYHQSKHIAMGEMMENIAHQWRQPLSQINSSVLIVDDLLSEYNIKSNDIEEKLSEIESLTLYMSKTITEFQDFYDDEKESKEFFLEESINDAINLVDANLKYHGIEIQRLQKSKTLCVGYPSALKQVLIVLLNNAKDALSLDSKRDTKIVVKVTHKEGRNSISVCDEAGGIDEKIIEHIFEPYFTTKHKSQGRGLGLYIAKKITEDKLNGNLRVENREHGACFIIELEAYKNGM